MKLKKITIENVKSFLKTTSLTLKDDISIIVGPNGGGKTNLLDIITTTLRVHFLKAYYKGQNHNNEVINIEESPIDSNAFQKHYNNESGNQVIEIEIEVTQVDLDNIKFIKETAKNLNSNHYKSEIERVSCWNEDLLKLEETYTYKITNNQLDNSTNNASKNLFLQYLNYYQKDLLLRENLSVSLVNPILFFPTNRSLNSFPSSISLAHANYNDLKKRGDNVTSKTINDNTILIYALTSLFKKFRELQGDNEGKAIERFFKQKNVKLLKERLNDLRYDWKEITEKDRNNNDYNITINRNNRPYSLETLSSGEKEIFNYLFTILGLNTEGALILIDEAELHLHPAWQKELLSLFQILANETSNQFIISTHSPALISAKSIESVSRIFIGEEGSEIINLNENKNLPEERKLISIINSHNNEKIFFTDKIIFVEGISDRVFFEAIFKHLEKSEKKSEYEIIDVDGKGNFSAYQKVANEWKIPYSIIADLDYAKDIGSEEIKNLFSINHSKIKEIVNDPLSKDAKKFFDKIQQAIELNNIEELKEIWNYIKARHSKMNFDLSEKDEKSLKDFIEHKQKDNIFILSEGNLEDYLPLEYRAKKIENLLDFVKNGFWEKLDESKKDELKKITENIFK